MGISAYCVFRIQEWSCILMTLVLFETVLTEADETTYR